MPGHDLGIRRRRSIGEETRAAGQRHAGERAAQVLEQERHAGERRVAIERRRLAARLVVDLGDDRVQLRVQLLDARDRRFQNFARRHLAGVDQLRQAQAVVVHVLRETLHAIASPCRPAAQASMPPNLRLRWMSRVRRINPGGHAFT